MGGFAVVAADPLAGSPDMPVGTKEPVPFFDGVARVFEDGRANANLGGRQEAYRQQLWARHDEAERLAGKRLLPSTSMLDGGPYGDHGGEIDPTVGGRVLMDAAYEAQLPKGVRSLDAVRAATDARLNAIHARAADAGFWSQIVGMAGATATDPINIGGAILTGGWGASRPLLARMLMQGTANAGIAALTAPAVAAEAQTYGGPKVTARDVAGDVAGAFVFGAGFEVGGAALGAATKRVLPGAAKRAGQLLETAARDDAAIGPVNADHASAGPALARGQAPPMPEPDRDLAEVFAGSPDDVAATAEYKGRPIHMESLDPRTLATDAATFQFKMGGDDAGVTARLRTVEQWDPTSSGKVIAWEDRAGRRFIADGHQRLGLARRLIDQGHEDFGDIRLDGYVLRQADGWSAAEARTVAALKNLREASGTPLDAAKVLRAAPEALTDRSLPVSGEFISQGRGLAALSDDVFGQVVNKALPERWGAEIGQMAPAQPELHAGLAQTLRTADPADLGEVRAVIREAMDSEWVKAQGAQSDLFGPAPEISAMIGRAKVKAAVMRELGRDQKVFGQLVRNADAMEAGGNSLARDGNAARLALDSAALGVMNRLAHREGPIGALLGRAGAKVAAGEATAAKASAPVLKALREALEDGRLADLLRAEVIDPPAPSPALRALVDGFDDPDGAAAKAQAPAKPEDAAFEAAPLARLTGEELAPAGADIVTLRAAAAAHMKGMLKGVEINSQALGGKVKIGASGIRKALALSADPDKLRVVQALPDLIARGRLVDTRPPYDARPNIRAWHTLEGGVELAGQPRTVRVTIREDGNGNFYWDHRMKGEDPAVGDPELGADKRAAGEAGGEALPRNMAPGADEINLTIETAADAAPPGLFDDLDDDGARHLEAVKRLAACAPGEA